MQILSDHRGIVLIFGSRGELTNTINRLVGLLEWVIEEDTNPPHLYSFFNDGVDRKEVEELLDEIKPEAKETHFDEN